MIACEDVRTLLQLIAPLKGGMRCSHHIVVIEMALVLKGTMLL